MSGKKKITQRIRNLRSGFFVEGGTGGDKRKKNPLRPPALSESKR